MAIPMVATRLPVPLHLQPSSCWRNNIIANAAEVGQYTLDVSQEIQVRHPSIGDVRGKGLMIGVEFVKDKRHKGTERRDPQYDRDFRF